MTSTNKKFNKRRKFNKSKNVKKTRKEIRKEHRKLKKSKRNEYYMNKGKGNQNKEENLNLTYTEKKNSKPSNEINSIDILTKQRKKEEKEKQKLNKQMQKQRTKQLLEANEMEDINIKKLEKQLKLNKKKTSDSITKSFAGDGLDYILEMCDSETRKAVATAHKSLSQHDIEAKFDDDLLELFDNGTHSKSDDSDIESLKLRLESSDENSDYEENCFENNLQSADDEDSIDESDNTCDKKKLSKNKKLKKNLDSIKKIQPSEIKSKTKLNKSKRKADCYSSESDSDEEFKQNKKLKKPNFDSNDSDSGSTSTPCDFSQQSSDELEKEDIYGRKRDKDGNIISKKGVYIPPSLRNEPTDKEKDAILRLKKQMKGLLNRVTTNNMISISNQIENLYNRGDHSRHNLNNTFCSSINEEIVQSIARPDQIIIDLAILISILHANIDTEIGAIYLETIVQKYNEIVKNNAKLDTKELNNIVHMISLLYALKVVHCTIVHNILNNLISNGLTERNIECILLILTKVGPILRKDDLVLMKSTLECIHNTINSTPEDVKSEHSTRLKFMLEILTSIKNNNFMKIPKYSPNDVPEMRRVLRQALHPGKQVVQLNISLSDLLNVNKRGKWWIVGSAWTGMYDNESSNEDKQTETSYETNEEITENERLLKLAKKHRMNTESRKRIFVVLMGSNNCDDAYEKLLRLGLRREQEPDIMNILLLGCLNEQSFNEYYAALALKFCDQNRKYMIMLRNALWDKFQEISDWPERKKYNLALFLVKMFINNGLSLGVLRTINFSDLNVNLLTFLRATFFGILLLEDVDLVKRIWSRTGNDQRFKSELHLFIEQFFLRPNILNGLEPNKRSLLESRGRIAMKILQRDSLKNSCL